MKLTDTFKEARRLHKLGFAIHWLHPKSKRPIETGWTEGPRKAWDYLAETYIEGLNVGVRLGEVSKIGKGYLTVVDIDVKSTDKRHRAEAWSAAKALIGDIELPVVQSGRGNGSKHYYCLTKEPFKTFNPAQSKETVKVHMPSKKPSKKELATLTKDEISQGIRLSHAWEISLYSNGRQVVLPPSIHPDSGELYLWRKHLHGASDLPMIDFSLPEAESDESAGPDAVVDDRKKAKLEDFEVSPVDLDWLPVSDEVRNAIKTGEGVSDRSGYLLRASSALLSAGLDQNEVLTVLTDPDTYLGACGYEHAQTKSRKRAAEWVYKYTLKGVSAERSVEGLFTHADDMEPERVLTKAEQAEQAKELGELRHWSQDLAKNQNGNIKSTIENVVLILTNAVAPDVFVRDDFSLRDQYGCDAPWGAVKGALITDEDVAKIRLWIGRQYGLEPSRDAVYDAIITIATDNAFDPVKDMLDALPAWDEKPRLDTWLKDHFEAKDDEGSGYLGQVFSKWMVALVMRAYNPGSKFDWMPIFEGHQGAGKSSFGRLLVGDKYFLDWLPNLNDKDSALALQGAWCVEMGELASMRRNELETVKAYVVRSIDKLRPPFGRRLIESPRRCVFFGTTNKEHYLLDDTGNRRFKPVVVGRLNFKQLRKDRLQLFAEAKYLWDNKLETEETLYLENAARDFEAKLHQEKMILDDSDAMKEAMENFIKKVQKEESIFNFKKFRISDLFEGVGPLRNWKADNRNFQFCAKMLKKLGAKPRKIKGLNYWNIEF